MVMLLLILLCASLRIAAALGTYVIAKDSTMFFWMASLAEQGRISEFLDVGYHPLYPALIVLLKPLFGSYELTGLVISIVFACATIYPLYLLMSKITTHDRALLACFIYTMHPCYIDVQSEILTEGCFIFFLVVSFLITLNLIQKPSFLLALLFSISSGLAFLTRPEGILIILVVFIWLLVKLLQTKRVQFLLTLLSIIFIFALACAPFLFYLSNISGKPTIIRKGSAQQILSLITGGQSLAKDLSAKLSKGILRAHNAIRIWVAIPVLIGLISLLRTKSGTETIAFLLIFVMAYYAAIFALLMAGGWTNARYFLPPNILLFAFAADGLYRLAGYLGNERFQRHVVPCTMVAPKAPLSAKGAQKNADVALRIILLVIVPLCVYKAFELRRLKDLHLRMAGEWILNHFGPEEKIMSESRQITYYAKGKHSLLVNNFETAVNNFKKDGVEFFIITREDLNRRLSNNFESKLKNYDGLVLLETIDHPISAGDTVWIYKITK